MKPRFESWFKKHLGEYARDIANHGADAGYPHITYTADCARLFKRFEVEIWEILAEDADEQGISPPALIAQLRRQDMTETWDQFRNLMVWYACERVAGQLEDRHTAKP